MTLELSNESHVKPLSLKQIYCGSLLNKVGHVMIRDSNINVVRKGKDKKPKARVQEDLFIYSVRQIRQYRWIHRNNRDNYPSRKSNKKPHIIKAIGRDRLLKSVLGNSDIVNAINIQ